MTDKEFQKFMIDHMTKLADDVTDIRQNMVRMEFQLTEKVNILFDGQKSINKKLDEHTAILNKHSAILDEHTAILNKHSAILDEHTAILNKHSAILDEHTEILADHTEHLQRIEDKVEKHDIQIQVLDKTKSNKRQKAK